MRLLLSCLILLYLSACSQHTPTTDNQATSKKPNLVSLNQFSSSFLFMAAQDAMATGDSVKAVRFLRVLVEKDNAAIQPRMQLIELLLHHDAGEEALIHTQELLNMDMQAQQKSDLKKLQIRTLMLLQRHPEAIQQAIVFLKQQPEHLGMRTTLIRLYMETNQFPQAMDTINAGLKLNDNPKLKLLQVRMFMVQKKHLEAEKSLLELQQSQPKNPVIPILASELAETSKDFDKAEKILRDFLRKEPDSLSVYHTLTKLFMRLERHQEAIDLYQGLQQRMGHDASIASAIGLIYYQIEDYANAEKSFQQAWEQQQNDSTRFYLAMTLEAQHKTARAAQLYRQFNTDADFYVKAQLRLAGIAFSQEKLTDSADILLKLSQLIPELNEPYYLLFNVRSLQKAYQQYIEESQAMVENSKQADLNILFNRAIAFEKLKNTQAMEQSLRAILKQEPEHAESLNFLGYSFAERGIHLAEAETLIQQALILKPKDGYYLDSLAWVYYQRQEYKKALEKQQEAVQVITDDPIMFEHLGDILHKLNRLKDAHDAWLKAIALKHTQPEQIQRKLAD